MWWQRESRAWLCLDARLSLSRLSQSAWLSCGDYAWPADFNYFPLIIESSHVSFLNDSQSIRYVPRCSYLWTFSWFAGHHKIILSVFDTKSTMTSFQVCCLNVLLSVSPPSERMCPLPRVALQLLEASLWPASAPHWAPCRLPTCTSMPWSLSTTRFPHQRSTTGLRARLRCCRPRPARWPATTWVAWGASLSWFLPRRGTVQSSSRSSSRERTVQRGDGTEGSGTKAGMDALAWFLALYYLHTGIFSAYGDPALLWCWEENLSCAQQSKWSFYQMQKHTKKLLWILSPGRKVSVGIKQTGKVNIYCIYACFFV